MQLDRHSKQGDHSEQELVFKLIHVIQVTCHREPRLFRAEVLIFVFAGDNHALCALCAVVENSRCA